MMMGAGGLLAKTSCFGDATGLKGSLKLLTAEKGIGIFL